MRTAELPRLVLAPRAPARAIAILDGAPSNAYKPAAVGDL